MIFSQQLMRGIHHVQNATRDNKFYMNFVRVRRVDEVIDPYKARAENLRQRMVLCRIWFCGCRRNGTQVVLGY